MAAALQRTEGSRAAPSRSLATLYDPPDSTRSDERETALILRRAAELHAARPAAAPGVEPGTGLRTPASGGIGDGLGVGAAPLLALAPAPERAPLAPRPHRGGARPPRQSRTDLRLPESCST